MFAVVYRFEVIPSKEESFIQAWKTLTQLIYKHEGSLGSRLHLSANNTYLAYAQWPSKTIWENAGKHMPPEADKVCKQMKESCKRIETIHTMDLVEDLLQQTIHNKDQ